MECFEKLEIVREFIGEISAQRDMGKLINGMTRLITKLTRSDRSSLFLYDKEREELWTVMAEGIEEEIRVPVDRSIAGGAIRDRSLQVVQDVSDDIRFNRHIDKKTGYETKNILACPLFDSKNELMGVIEVINKLEGPFEEDDINALKLFSSFIGYMVETKILNEEMEQLIAQRTAKIEELNRELEAEIKVVKHLSETDSLTGIYNRMKIDALMAEMVANPGEKGFGVILFDIDDFKAINDSFGHLSGDKVLIAVADAASKLVPETAFFGRWGGEEFMVVLPSTTPAEALEIAETLRKAVMAADTGIGRRATCSFGVAAFQNTMGSDDLIKAVDQAMYRAKGEGKNRVVGV